MVQHILSAYIFIAALTGSYITAQTPAYIHRKHTTPTLQMQSTHSANELLGLTLCPLFGNETYNQSGNERIILNSTLDRTSACPTGSDIATKFNTDQFRYIDRSSIDIYDIIGTLLLITKTITYPYAPDPIMPQRNESIQSRNNIF